MHILHAFDLLHQAGQLGQRVDLHGGRDHRGLVVENLHLEGRHVDAVLGDHRRDVTQQALPVESLDLDGDRIQVICLDLPVDRHHALAVLRIDRVDAIGAVDGDASSARRVADDRITGDGLAAWSDLGQQTLLAAHEHAGQRLNVGDQRDRAQVPRRAIGDERHLHDHRMR